MAEWSASRTRSPVVPGLSLALATCWICSRSSRAQILGHACKYPTGCLLPVGVLNPVMLYCFLSITDCKALWITKRKALYKCILLLLVVQVLE